MTDYQIRKMTRDELDFAVDLAADEGWNPGIHDADCFHAADPEGFLLGLLDGEPIGTVSVVRYPGGYGFLGFYIVKPDWRGKGYGLELFTRAMERMEGRDIGLDGVLEQVGNYEKWGFRTAHHNIRWQGTAAGDQDEAGDGSIIALGEVPFEQVLAYDRRMFSSARPAFLRCWIDRPGHTALGFVENGALKGYTVFRECRMGVKIGPLIADTPELAERLFRAGSSRLVTGTPISLDVPAPNAAGVDLAQRHGMEPVFETARMYRMVTRPEMDFPLENWFGVTSFELG